MQNKSFTLIELLVVIAIIGLLASVVLVSTQGLQTKAKLTKTLEFSQTLNNALGAYAVGSWSFDEGSGTSALDASGYGNNGTISGATYNADTPHAAIGRGTGKWALNFDGVNDYVRVPDSNSLTIIGSFTLEAWVKPFSLSSPWQTIFEHNGNWIFIFSGSGEIAYQFSGVTPKSNSLQWNNNQYYHIAVALDDVNKIVKFYRDGINIGQSTYTGSNNWGGDASFMGTYDGVISPSYMWNGLIDEVRIYEAALALGQIRQLYAEGLKRHADLAIK